MCYAVIKLLIYTAVFPDYALARLISGVVMILVVFVLTSHKKLSRRQIAVLAPLSLAIIELVTVSVNGGDQLTYLYLVSCALMCLMYTDVFALLVMTSSTAAITALFIFAFDIRLMSENGRLSSEVFNFIGMIALYIIIMMLGRYSVSMFVRFRKTGQTFDTVLGTSPNLIVIINEKAQVEYISKAFVNLMGVSKQEYACNLPFIDMFTTVPLKLFFSKLLERQGHVVETFSMDIKGERRWFMLHSVTIGESRVARLFDCVEITSIVESQQAAEAATRSKSEFLATMSHEIRTPLNAIIGITQIHLQKDDLSSEYAEAFSHIYGSGNSLLGIINDILDMSKIETGKLELNPVQYDVPSFINDAVQLNIVRIGSKPIEFILNIDEQLPSRLYGDEVRLKQVLNNLLSNAIKYTDEGSITLSISHVVDYDDIILNFVISDTGQGIKPEDKKKLFTEYIRFNASANRFTEGTGLGLSITKRLVEMMDGSVEVDSEYGRGSVFSITIRQKSLVCQPIGAEVARLLSCFMFTSNMQAENLRFTRERMPYGSVLVVDDVETNLYVAQGLMSPYGLNIETVSSGIATLDKIGAGDKYDIIFMDHMMPQLDGIETTRRLRALGYHGTIVALTANALVGNDEMFARLGFDGFIPKPIDIRQLNNVLNKFIRDRYPEEAAKYKPEEVAPDMSAWPLARQADAKETDPNLLRIFTGDARNAITTLRQTAADGDIELLSITAHGMKSALANVNEPEASALALALENAGHSNDLDYIASHLEGFLNVLEELILKHAPKASAAGDGEEVVDDKAFLAEQLLIIKEACGNYDDDTAFAALDRLDEKRWSPEVAGLLEQMRDSLFIYSDFDKAAEIAAQML